LHLASRWLARTELAVLREEADEPHEMSSELAARGYAHWFAKLTLGPYISVEQRLGDHITAAENAMQSVKVLGVKTP